MSAVYGPSLKYSGNYSNMDSRNIHTQHHEQQHQISGLLRYRSAPSSLLTNPVGREGGFRSYVPSLGEEMEGMLDSGSNSGWSNVKNEEGGGGPVFCNEADEHIYDSHEGIQEFALSESCSNVMMNNTIMDFQNSSQSKMASGNYSNNLLRQKTSPPGIFSNFSLTNAKLLSVPSSTCSRRMPQIAENGNENLEQHQEEEARICVESRKLRNDYMPSFTGDFWEGTSFAAQKTASDSNEFVFSTSNASESQPADQFGYHNVGFTHQMSLPNSSTKKDGIETILHIQGSVPCKIRAKRGFATHPRSIAERVRRTRISERIKKLQDLFPKSDKQTNTTDMLDLTVDYIKDLQKQVKILTDTKAKCICFQKQRWS